MWSGRYGGFQNFDGPGSFFPKSSWRIRTGRRAESLIKEWGTDKAGFVQTDALDPESIKSAIEGADVVLNCVGPFYKSVKIILGAVLESGVNYVDVCDDVDVTLDILAWDKKAKDFGVSACIGMGSSPGGDQSAGQICGGGPVGRSGVHRHFSRARWRAL